MPNNKWEDEHIENLLKDFPVIKDERPKEDIYKRLQQAHKPLKKPKHWLPYLVAALAFLTFGVLLASMLGQNSNDSAFQMGGSESSEESADTNSTAVEEGEGAEAESAEMESSEAEESAEESEGFNSTENNGEQAELTLYDEQLDGMSLFTVGLTENAVVIPVSFIIWHDQLQEDFGTTDVAAAELYNRYAAELDEPALGFDDYHPYSGTITETAAGIEHMLPADHNYDMASAPMSVYFNSLSASFSEAAEISVIDESGNAADFDQVGPVQPINPADLNIAYYGYTTAKGYSYLVPGYDMPHENAVDAINAMKSSPNDLFASLIPAGLEYSVTETEATVTVEFTEALDLDSYKYQEALRMIEGMVLTADSFGKELMLDNTSAKSWDMFDFTESLPVPAGINIKALNS